MSSPTFNFKHVSALLVDDDGYACDLTGSILRNFGLAGLTTVSSGGEAQRVIESGRQFELVICEAVLSDMLGAQFVEWVRRRPALEVKFVPIVVLTGHTQIQNVLAARDSGAHALVKKPISPSTFFERIVWAGTNTRPFVETGTYAGPDRRVRNLGPPDGVGRRETDLSTDLGAASEPNMSQAEVDSFMKPMRMSIE